MKKFCYLTLLLCLSLFSACSDSDDSLGDKLSKQYTVGRNLTFIMNGTEAYGGTIKFKTNDLAKGSLVLKNLLPGENEIQLSDISITQQEGELYHFTAESKNTNRELILDGLVGESGMNVDATFKVISPVANYWTPRGQTAVTLYIDPASEDAKINMHGIMFQKEKSVADGFKTASNLCTIVFNMVINLKMDLKDSGDLIAEWGPKGKYEFGAGSSEKGMLRYNVGDDKIYIAIDLGSIIPGLIAGGMPTDIDIKEILAIVKEVSQGIPVDYEVNENGELSLLLTKERLLPYLELLMPMLGGALQDAEIPNIMGLNKESLSLFLPEFVNAIKESKDFSLTLVLNPVK